MNQQLTLLVTALASVLGGGVGLRLLERMLDRVLPDKAVQSELDKERRDDVRALMKDDFDRLEGYIKRLETELAALRAENVAERAQANDWRAKYYASHEQASLLTIQLAAKDQQLTRLQSEIAAK